MSRRHVVVLVLLVSMAAAGCSASSPPRTTQSASPTASASAPRPHVDVVLGQPIGMARAGDSIWATATAADEVVRVDPVSGEVTARVAVGDTPLRLAFDGKLVWVSVFTAGKVVAIDPASAAAVHSVDLPGQPEGVAAGFGSIWVVRQEARLLTRLDPTGRLVRSYPLGNEPRLAAVGERYVYASNFADGTVTRLDPATGALTTSGRLCDGAQGMATGGPHVLWVTCTKAGKVVTVDETTLKVIGSIDLPAEPDAVKVIGGAVWVVRADGPTVVQLSSDPAHPKVIREYRAADNLGLYDRANVDFAVVGDRFWVSAPQAGGLYLVRVQLPGS